jgi:hypothetical protein
MNYRKPQERGSYIVKNPGKILGPAKLMGWPSKVCRGPCHAKLRARDKGPKTLRPLLFNQLQATQALGHLLPISGCCMKKPAN